MKQPKISIITITFNSEKTLERTIKSVVEQNYDNLEYIIIDGGSKDGTLEIVKRYKQRIAKWISEPDNGISDAFNKGIRMATGDIVGIINSDDGLMPGALQTLADNYEEEVDVYRGSVLLWKEDTNTKTIEVPSMHINKIGLNHIGHQSTFIRKATYGQYGTYDTDCRYVMDFDLLLRFQNAGTKWKKIDSTLAFYTLGGVTFSQYSRKRMEETKRVIKKNGGNWFIIQTFFIVKHLRLLASKLFGKRLIMKLGNKKYSDTSSL